MSSLEIPQYDVRPPPFPTKLLETAIDSPRPIKIIVIGAGFSGTLAGVVFPRKIENIQLTIYDKNEDVGGTWLENRYPGVGCDVPSHAYQYSKFFFPMALFLLTKCSLRKQHTMERFLCSWS